MGSSAGPYQMDREPGAPFGMFNLAKFRAEVRSRVDDARTADTTANASYMNTSAYNSPPPSTAKYSRGSMSVDRTNIESRMLSRDGDEAYEKLHRRAESALAHSQFPPVGAKEAAEGRSVSSLDVVRAPRSSSFLSADPFRPDRLQWTNPEKWYALSDYSAQNNSQLDNVRNQAHRPALPTFPSQSPFSMAPSRINKFSDISPNPRLIDGKKKKRHSDESPLKNSKVGLAKFGHMRKCQNPFTEGWKVATFKPAREKMVPYTANVKKWVKGAGYGFIDLDGQDIFVHHSEVRCDKPLVAGDTVIFQLSSGLVGRRGIAEAHNVTLEIKTGPGAEGIESTDQKREAGQQSYALTQTWERQQERERMAQDRRMEVLHRKIKRLESEAELLETTSSSFGKEKGKDAILFLPTENFQPTSDKDEKVRRRLAEVHKAISQAREEMSLSQVKEAMQRPPEMSEEEYNDLVSRRKMDEDLRGMFKTGFWKYPISEETLPPDQGGISEEEMRERQLHSRNFTPYEQSISFDRKMTMVNPMTDEQGAKTRAPPLLLEDNGPIIEKKLKRKRWLAKATIPEKVTLDDFSKFLTKSTSRYPLAMPALASYYTSPVVNSTDEPSPIKRHTVHESATMSPTNMRAQMNPAPDPPIPVRNSQLASSPSNSRRSLDSLPSLSMSRSSIG